MTMIVTATGDYNSLALGAWGASVIETNMVTVQGAGVKTPLVRRNDQLSGLELPRAGIC